MVERHCPICGPAVGFRVVYEENLPSDSELIFSTRKTPDSYHYRMVQCSGCGLLYANPVLENRRIERLYERENSFDFEDEFDNLNATYSRYLKKVRLLAPSMENLLEIGCGSGFFLEKARKMGYENVYGIDPSRSAVENAPPGIRDNIICDVFHQRHFEKNFFDTICFFQVIEHVADINTFLTGCFDILKNKGIVLGIGHDASAPLARLLKDKCPIINNEHIYVFDRHTLKKVFKRNGFTVLAVSPVINTYSLSYWFRMTPLPRILKQVVLGILRNTRLANAKLSLGAGNMFIAAQKL